MLLWGLSFKSNCWATSPPLPPLMILEVAQKSRFHMWSTLWWNFECTAIIAAVILKASVPSLWGSSEKQSSPTDQAVSRLVCSFWYPNVIFFFFFGIWKDSVWPDEKQNWKQNAGKVGCWDPHGYCFEVPCWLAARRDQNVPGSAFWACEALQQWYASRMGNFAT